MSEEETAVPLVNIKRENYAPARTASGGKSLNNQDTVAKGLEGLNLDDLYEIASKFLAFPVKVKKASCENVGQLQAAYDSLNVGMQRMNLGNRIRARVTAIDVTNEKEAAAAVKDGKEPKAAKSGADKLVAILSPYVKARDKAIAAEVKAKADAKAAAAKEEKAA